MMKFIKRLFLVAFVLIGALFAFVFFASAKERPVPDHIAGYTETTLNVAHRDIPLPVMIWYPTDSIDAPDLIAQNALFYGFHARRDAAGSEMPAPILVFSHGSGGDGDSISWIASALAEQGIIVMATNHPGTTSRDSTPEATVRLWERAQDMTAMLDFAQDGLPFGISADMDRVASMGFSLGGYSALAIAGMQVSKTQFLEYCATFPDKIDCGWMNAGGLDFNAIDQVKYEQSNLDPRIMTVVAVDPALPRAVTDAAIAAYSVPTLIVQLGDTETIFEGMRWGDNVSRIPAVIQKIIPDTYHFGFLRECSLMGKVIIQIAGDDNICSDAGTRPRALIHEEAIALITDFLVEQLKPTP